MAGLCAETCLDPNLADFVTALLSTKPQLNPSQRERGFLTMMIACKTAW